MTKEEMIYYEDELLEELSKNKIKRADILIDLNVALQKYQGLVANIKDAREIQEYKIAVVSVESELKELQQENQKLKEKLEASERARKELEDKINKTNDYINKNPLVCVGDYEYFVNDIMQMESFSNKMSFIRTLKENLDIDKGEMKDE